MRAIAVVRALGPIDLKSVQRDPLLRWMVALPLGLALLFRFGIPPLGAWLESRFGMDLAPHMPLVASFLLLGIPMLFGAVIGFLLLDEKDDHTLVALQVTPLSTADYLAYRTAVPTLLAVGTTLVAMPLSGTLTVGPGALLASAVAAAPMAPAFALFVAAFARNKVQGFALLKAAGTVNWPPTIAWFVAAEWQWAFGLCPTYWPAKLYWQLAGDGAHVGTVFLAGVAYWLLLLGWLLRRFDRVTH